MLEGIVIRSTGSWYTVLDSSGNEHNCKLKGNFKIKGIKSTNPIAVGDAVEFEITDEVGLIHIIHDRKNYIIRKSTKLSKKTHIIASNIDQALLVVSLINPKTTLGFMDRFLITAEAYSIPVIIVFNKYDLYEETQLKELKKLKQIYSKAGYDILYTSAVSNLNLDTLENKLAAKKTLLAGQSGVGKSALIKCLAPNLDIKIGEISTYHTKGKHTTTFAQMFALQNDTYIIDTPGVKEFGLIDFHRHELSHYFPEMRQYLGDCKFNNCMHELEKSCAVKEALEAREISPERYQSYLNILHDEALLSWENQFRPS